MRFNRVFIFSAAALLVASCVLCPIAYAEDDPRAAQAAPETKAVAPPKLPWFVMTGRLAFGGGSGSADFQWDAFDGMLNHEEKNVPVQSLSHSAFIPEAFFMPTKARGFIISASLAFGGGTGKMGQSDPLTTTDFNTDGIRYSEGDRIFDGEDIRYRFAFLNLGLGYQWYFGAQKRTNLFLMSHIGPGNSWFEIDYHGDTRTSRALRSGDFDVSVGSWHRFPNNFVLGGSLDYWVMRFSGQAGSGGYLDTYVDGGMGIVRLNFLAGYAFE